MMECKSLNTIFLILLIHFSRKIGTSTYHLSEDGHLMFRGSKNLSRNISMLGAPVENANKRNRGRAFVSPTHQPLLKIDVTSLPPSISR